MSKNTMWLGKEDCLYKMVKHFIANGNAIGAFRYAYDISDKEFKAKENYWSVQVNRMIRSDKFKAMLKRIGEENGNTKELATETIGSKLDEIMSDPKVHPDTKIRAMTLKAKILNVGEDPEDSKKDNKIEVVIKHFNVK